MPKNPNLNAVESNVEHGTVVVRIPKLEGTKPQSRRIEIKSLQSGSESTENTVQA